MKRPEAREQAFLLLFDKSFHPEMELDEVIELACADDMVKLNSFARNAVQTVCGNLEEIDGEIEQNLQGWKMQRISRVSLALLRLAIGELRVGDTPQGVVVNEAVELCKTYAGSEDASFVNGVLRSYLRKKEAQTQ